MTTTPRRLTRVESQALTRTRIIDAATTLFLRDGFRATTLEQIGEEAGYTRGAVYSNFASKTEMGIAVIDAIYAREEANLSEALGQDDWLAAITTWAEATVGDPAWVRLELEIAASSAGEPSYQAAASARYARLRAQGRERFAERFGDGIELNETLMVALLGMLLGIGAQRSVDPSISVRAWSDGVRLLAGGLLEPGRDAATSP